MKMIDENIEKLIVRHLDAELTTEEELELNRELIRNPEARRLMEDYQRIDASAASALNHALATGSFDLDTEALTSVPSSSPRNKGRYRAWWLIPGAVAAAMLAWIVPNPSFEAPQDPQAIVQHDSPPPIGYAKSARPTQPDGITRNVSTGLLPPRIKRSTGREVFGVVGEDGNVYWIQAERVRTLTRPNSRSAGQLSSEVM